MVRQALCLLAAAAFIAAAAPAFACPVLEKANPRVGGEVKAGVTTVTLAFTGHVFPDRSTVEVTNAAGDVVSKGKPYGPDAKNDGIVAVRVASLPPGEYRVTWNVFCDCGSYAPGDYGFTVK